MAIIENISTGEKIVLRTHHVFGRQAINTDTRLTHPEISNIHASIRWNGEVWTLKDLSLNGTWLGNERVLKNRDIELSAGQQLSFGSQRHNVWRIKHLSEPVSTLIALDGKMKGQMKGQSADIVLDRIQVLPDEQNPQVSLYISQSGQWVCEQEDRTFPLNNGDTISLADGRSWRLYLPDNIEFTSDISADDFISKDSFACCFNVSADEEHVFLKIKLEGQLEFDLEERVHHYLLLVLARQRDKDAKEGFNESSQGWVYMEDLSVMMGITLTHLNILIFRARKQVQQVFSRLAFVPQPIERRQGAIRFGFTQYRFT